MRARDALALLCWRRDAYLLEELRKLPTILRTSWMARTPLALLLHEPSLLPLLKPYALRDLLTLTDEQRVAHLGRLYADTVMGMGGSKPAAQVFELFRGRGPTATALLRHDGLL